MKQKNKFKRYIHYGVFALFVLVASIGFEMSVFDKTASAAQVCNFDPNKPNRVVSIRQKNIKKFERISELFDEEKTSEASTVLAQLSAIPDLNAIEKAYVANYKGNINFTRDNLNGALTEFKKILKLCEGISQSFYNQIIYVVAQVYFSKEDYRNALDYAQAWKQRQADPSADAFMLIGQAQYMLKQYNSALPNVQKGISKYEEAGLTPKEGWLNLLGSIYRQKNDYRKMLPVYKQLVQFYPKKTYLLALGGIYNELGQQDRMTAMYQALYDQGLMDKENELITLASLLLSSDNSYKASQILSKGMNSGLVKKTEKNYRTLSQALMMSKEYSDAIAPLTQAAKLSSKGKLYNQLGQSYTALNRWNDAEVAFGRALSKGGLTSTGQTFISLGLVQFEQKKYAKAIESFKKAKKYEKTALDANKWIQYVDDEVTRINKLNEEVVISADVNVSS